MTAPIVDPPKADPPKADPPKADPPKADPPKADPPPEPEPKKNYSQAEVDRMIAKREAELKKEADKAAEKAKLSEDERKDAEITELRNSIRQRDARDIAMAELSKVEAQSPPLMFNAIKDDLEFDDSGKIKNLADLVKGLQADYPDQFGKQKPGEGIDGGAGGGGTVKLTREAIDKMSTAEINANWDAVQAFMSGNK